jgi:hypothetical protein
MPTYHFGRAPFVSQESNFLQFVELVKGRSIVSLADGDDFLELGLSGNIMVHISKGGILSSGTIEVRLRFDPESRRASSLCFLARGDAARSARVAA